MAQVRVQREVKAIMDTVQLCGTAGIPIIGSAAIRAELDDIGNYAKRECVRDFYEEVITVELTETDSIIERALELTTYKIGNLDAYHIAFAEAAETDYLLTTDDRFERAAEKLDLKTKIINPINFLGEYFIWRLS